MSTPQDTTKATDGASQLTLGLPKVRKTYPQDWPAYNKAQTREKEMVAGLLRDLCDAVESPRQGRGRPRIPLSDAIFAATMKVYATTSGRRSMTDIREYEARGLIGRAPSYNSIFDYLDNPVLTPLLQAMIEESAKPLRSVETEFAVDSTGFSTSVFRRWFDHKYGRMKSSAEYVKAHVMVGVKTNIVTSVEVTPFYVNDYPLLPRLLETGKASFNVEKLSADKGYSGRSNVEAICAAGAIPLVAFKSNARAKTPGLWKQAFEFFRDHAEEFYRQYHQRSNVETAFSMMKAKFGGYVRSKTPTAQMNEVLCKVLCHNLCCLTGAVYELGISPTFWENGRPDCEITEPAWQMNLPPRAPWTGPKKRGRRLEAISPPGHLGGVAQA